MNDHLPAHLEVTLAGRGTAEPETFVLVAQLELYKIEVVVRRLQLGSQRAEGFGEWRTIYASKPQN